MNKQVHYFTVNGVTRPLFNRSRLKSFLWTICFFLFFAVALGHQWNPFVTALNQSRPQLLAYAKKQATH